MNQRNTDNVTFDQTLGATEGGASIEDRRELLHFQNTSTPEHYSPVYQQPQPRDMLNQMDQIINQGLMTDLTPVATTSADVAPPTVGRTSQEDSVLGVLQPTLAAGTATKPAVTPNPITSNRITHATIIKSPGRAMTASLQP